MFYRERVVNKSAADMTCEDWLILFARGKSPRPDPDFGLASDHPPPDVYDLVMGRELADLEWRTRELCRKMLEPTVNGSPGALSSLTVSRGELLSQFSGLWDFLTSPTYSTGKRRSPGRLSVSLGSEGLKVTLSDDTSGTYCTRVAATLDDALLALETAIGDGSLKWHKSDFVKTKK